MNTAILPDDIRPGDTIRVSRGGQYVVLYVLETCLITCDSRVVNFTDIVGHYSKRAIDAIVHDVRRSEGGA